MEPEEQRYQDLKKSLQGPWNNVLSHKMAFRADLDWVKKMSKRLCEDLGLEVVIDNGRFLTAEFSKKDPKDGFVVENLGLQKIQDTSGKTCFSKCYEIKHVSGSLTRIWVDPEKSNVLPGYDLCEINMAKRDMLEQIKQLDTL